MQTVAQILEKKIRSEFTKTPPFQAKNAFFCEGMGPAYPIRPQRSLLDLSLCPSRRIPARMTRMFYYGW